MPIGKHYDLDTDNTLANDSDSTIASQKAVKTYVDNQVSTKAEDSEVVHTTGNESISGNKTFTGSTNSVIFDGGKNQLKVVVPNNNTNGITFFNKSNKEVGYYQMNTSKNAMFMGYYSSSEVSNPTKFGYLIENGSNKYQVLIPYSSSIGSSSTPIYYLPLAITDGTNSVLADAEGNIDISTLLPSGGNVDDVQINGTSIVSAGIANITIDIALSNISENPVQNKVVKAALDDKQDTITSTNKLSASLIDGLSIIATSGSYNDLINKPSINSVTLSGNQTGSDLGLVDEEDLEELDINNIVPEQAGNSGKFLTTNGTTISWATVSVPIVNNSTITIQKNSTTVDSFTLNQSSNKTIDISVPTKTSDLQNDSGFTTNTGTVTSVQVQAGTGLTSSESSAQTTTLSTTIGIDSNYKLPTTAEFSAKEDVPTEVSESSASVTLDIAANTNYDLTNTDITDITLNSCESSSLESTITFSTGATAPTLTDNSGISWINGSAPILNSSMSYIILIWKKKGFVKEY